MRHMLLTLMLTCIASTALGENPRVNTQVLRVSPHHGDLISVRSSDTADHLLWSAAVFASYGQNPLAFVD
ncbi:MAG: hypothetical protein ACI9MR_003513, partial [Myxococcota bacterium]